MQSIQIYTDGACKGNPGLGGWGALILYEQTSLTQYGTNSYTTNNRMELTAVIQSIQIIKNQTPINLYTDSQYVQKGITQWLKNWIKNDWLGSNKKKVKNYDLWIQLHQLNQVKQINWHWVKGHSNNLGNQLADWLANTAVINYKNNNK